MRIVLIYEVGEVGRPRSRGHLRCRVLLAIPLVVGLSFGLSPGTLGADRNLIQGVWVERESFLMGTRLRIRVRAPDRPSGIHTIDNAFTAVALYEAMLSSWTRDSEISRLNRTEVNAAVTLSDGLGDLLAQAFHWSEETEGAFQPMVGALLDVWGVRDSGWIPTKEALDGALSSIGQGAIDLDFAAATATRRDEAAWIDAGAFGKGAALKAAVHEILKAGVKDALLDFGGQIMTLGSPVGEQSGWLVSVAHPQRRFEPVGALRVTNASVATSGASERHMVIKGRRLSHVIDPRTGQLVPPWGSVTVVSEDPLAADAIATALFVLGPEAGMEWVRKQPDIGVLFLIEGSEGQLEKRWNLQMAAWLQETGNESFQPEHRNGDGGI